MASQNLLNRPEDNSQPVVAVDLEGTLTAGVAWRGMYDYLLAHGKKKGVKGFYYARLPEYFLRRLTGKGLQKFKNDWVLDLLRKFRGFSPEAFQDMAHWAVENELWPQRRQEVLDELAKHQEAGRRIVIVTGLFEPYVAAFLFRLPGYEAIGTPIEYENGEMTGELAAPFNVGTSKVKKLEPFLSEGKIFAAYGDTFSDRHMLRISQNPAAVHPDRKLRRLAQEKGWRILE